MLTDWRISVSIGLAGGDEKGDDVAVLMTATWKSVHQSVLANKPLKEFKLRQYLFSAKARLLYRLNRPTEVVDRGLKFIQDFSKLISEREHEIGLHPYFREVLTRTSDHLPCDMCGYDWSIGLGI